MIKKKNKKPIKKLIKKNKRPERLLDKIPLVKPTVLVSICEALLENNNPYIKTYYKIDLTHLNANATNTKPAPIYQYSINSLNHGFDVLPIFAITSDVVGTVNNAPYNIEIIYSAETG